MGTYVLQNAPECDTLMYKYQDLAPAMMVYWFPLFEQFPAMAATRQTKCSTTHFDSNSFLLLQGINLFL